MTFDPTSCILGFNGALAVWLIWRHLEVARHWRIARSLAARLEDDDPEETITGDGPKDHLLVTTPFGPVPVDIEDEVEVALNDLRDSARYFAIRSMRNATRQMEIERLKHLEREGN